MAWRSESQDEEKSLVITGSAAEHIMRVWVLRRALLYEKLTAARRAEAPSGSAAIALDVAAFAEVAEQHICAQQRQLEMLVAQRQKHYSPPDPVQYAPSQPNT